MTRAGVTSSSPHAGAVLSRPFLDTPAAPPVSWSACSSIPGARGKRAPPWRGGECCVPWNPGNWGSPNTGSGSRAGSHLWRWGSLEAGCPLTPCDPPAVTLQWPEVPDSRGEAVWAPHQELLHPSHPPRCVSGVQGGDWTGGWAPPAPSEPQISVTAWLSLLVSSSPPSWAPSAWALPAVSTCW